MIAIFYIYDVRVCSSVVFWCKCYFLMYWHVYNGKYMLHIVIQFSVSRNCLKTFWYAFFIQVDKHFSWFGFIFGVSALVNTLWKLVFVMIDLFKNIKFRMSYNQHHIECENHSSYLISWSSFVIKLYLVFVSLSLIYLCYNYLRPQTVIRR